MAERARMANVPMPETDLKCPRCDSTNTKFCYFNNYSLTQPRHFCKTCRRYWTRGGALRNVPVGGGCRRNKRSKSSTSKSPASSDRQTNNPCSTSTVSTNTAAAAANMLGLTPPPLRFMSPLSHQFTDNFTGDMGLSYSRIAASTTTSEMNFHGGGATNFLGSGGMASLLSSDGGGGGIEPWRVQQVQQFPFLGGVDYQFHGGESGFVGGEGEGEASQQRCSPVVGSERAAAVKMESSGDQNRLRRETILNEQWNININMNAHNHNHNHNSWTDLSSFSSSSATSNPPL